MNDNAQKPLPEPTLFDEPRKSEPQDNVKPQSFVDQLVGVFTEPAEVFQRLRQSPTWVGAFITTLATGLFASLAWAAKVDPEAAAKRQFDVLEQAFRMKIPQEAIDQALEKAASQGQPLIKSALGALFMMPIYLLILSAIVFAFAKFGSEDEDVQFSHAWASVNVHSLVMLPASLLGGIMCLIRPVGGAPSFASLAPTKLAFWVQPENPWMRGLLSVVDPFYLLSFVMLLFAAKYTLRLKPWATALLLCLTGFFGFLFQFLGGMF